MPFADDVRKYTFASLDNLVSKKGEVITEHPYIPTKEQLDAMDNFVDSMDLMEAGEKDEEGCVSSILICLGSYASVITAIVLHGMTLFCRTTPPSTGQNKLSSTALSFPTYPPIQYLHPTRNSSNTSNLPEESSNVLGMLLRNVRLR